MSLQNAIIPNINFKKGVTMTDYTEQRAEIFKEIYGVSKQSDILEMFENDYNRFKNKGFQKLQELYRDYSYAIFFMYSPSSIRNNLVKFKNVIKVNGGKYQANALEYFTVDNVYAPIKRKDEDLKKELQEKVRKGESTSIAPEIVINEILELKKELDEKSYVWANNQTEEQVRSYKILAMLGLATGRRFTELMKTLKISKHGKKVMFDGLLKGNSETIEGHIIALEYLTPKVKDKPKVSDLKDFLKELREIVKTEDMTIDEVNSTYARVFNNAMSRLGFGKVKNLRHNYAVVGSQLFHKEGETNTETITRILGHKTVLPSALNYT
jgi:hypothetical protein